MSLSTQPENISFLSPLGYQFQIKRAPHLNYFIQRVEVPSVSLPVADVQTPFTKIPFAGNRIDFGQLTVTFKIDENMENYLEIFKWIEGMGYPDRFKQYADLVSKMPTTGEGVFSDLSLIVLTGSKNPNMEFTFIDCFPVDLTGLMFESTSVDVEYVTATVTFAHRKFDLKRLT